MAVQEVIDLLFNNILFNIIYFKYKCFALIRTVIRQWTLFFWSKIKKII